MNKENGIITKIGNTIKAFLHRGNDRTTKAADERWTLTAAGREYLHGKATGRAVYVPVYRNIERTDGKPSINTPEGWAALKQRMEAELHEEKLEG
ncbi:MAG: hypothetical protein ACI4MU_05070 [Candidatus Ventricola sp.]